jgi:hypothetical protein
LRDLLVLVGCNLECTSASWTFDAGS